MDKANDSWKLSDAVKESVIGSGVLANLKSVSYNVAPHSHDDTMEDLKQEAQTAIQAIKQLLDGLNPDIGVSLKLKTALLDLQTALAKGTVSRVTLETALAEAATAMSGADGNGQSTTAQQIEAQLWQRVETDNKDINDDFEKMRKAGIVFNDNLWNKHKELMEYLQAHPRDNQKQKELDAVDDAMLMQAEPQLAQYPDAKPSLEDAKKKSEDRHQVVDKDLAGISKDKSLVGAAFDDETPPAHGKLTMSDVASQSVGQKQKPAGKQYT